MNLERRRLFATLSLLVAAGLRGFAQRGPAVQVYKDPTCGCCALWVEHLRKAGFTATVTDVEDMNAVKTKHGVPQRARSCHTALVGAYVVEGHVPAADVQRLLQLRPSVVGIAVPGMPIGSPGMESPDGRKTPYDVMAFTQDGQSRVYASK